MPSALIIFQFDPGETLILPYVYETGNPSAVVNLTSGWTALAEFFDLSCGGPPSTLNPVPILSITQALTSDGQILLSNGAVGPPIVPNVQIVVTSTGTKKLVSSGWARLTLFQTSPAQTVKLLRGPLLRAS